MDLITYQKTLYESIKALGYDVYDYVPLDAPLPYVRLDYNQTLDDGTKTSEGYEVLQYINIFSNYRGQKQVREMAQNLINNVKEIGQFHVRLYSLDIREERYKQEKIQGTTLGTDYQATIILKIKI